MDIFRKICLERKDAPIQRARLNKGKLKAYISKKYKGIVAEKVT